MGLILTEEDFVNRWFIDKSTQSVKVLEDFIDYYEPIYLQDLLGYTLSTDFMADLSGGVPQNSPYIEIFEPINDDSLGIRSRGIKEMLTSFLYFEYFREQMTKNTTSGQRKVQSEVSEHVPSDSSGVYLKYNQAIDTYCAIQEYIHFNLETYPDYKGISKEKTTWL